MFEALNPQPKDNRAHNVKTMNSAASIGSHHSHNSTISRKGHDKSFNGIIPGNEFKFMHYNTGEPDKPWKPIMGVVPMKHNAREPKRTPLPQAVAWNGQYDTFKEYADKFESHFYQTNMGYLFHPRFQSLYHEYKSKAVHEWPDNEITEHLFIKDNLMLFGAIKQSTTRAPNAKTILHIHHENGLTAWMAI